MQQKVIQNQEMTSDYYRTDESNNKIVCKTIISDKMNKL